LKGKLKFSIKIMLTVAISLFAGVCFVGLQPNKTNKELPAHAVTTINGKDYSAKLDGDVILSVEKVAVDENGLFIKQTNNGIDYYKTQDGIDHRFYGRMKDIFPYGTATVDQIKADFVAGYPICFINSNKKFEEVHDVTSIDENINYYIANVLEITQDQAKQKFNEGNKICYVKNNTYYNVKNIYEITDNSTCTFYVINEVGEVPIYFKDIIQDGKKQVVEDGQFVMLNNKKVGDQYLNGLGDSDAVIISLGQYVLNGEQVSFSPTNGKENTEYAQLAFLNVNLTHNGKVVPDISLRNITSTDGGRFFDFMYMIREDGTKDIEGHYILTTTYIKGGVEYTTDFDFYLVCESTYTRTKTIDDQKYYSAPTLGWVDAGDFKEISAENDGYVHYDEGIDGINKTTNTISYPTITYDYTKYQLSYELVANRNVTKYSLNYNVKPNTDVEMLVTVTGANNYQIPFDLTNYNEDLKLVTVVFTEHGNYNFEFKYLYTGVDSALAPNMDKLKIDNKCLAIHGSDLNYSKQGFTSAKFNKFNFATNTNAKVNLIVPNGYLQTENEENAEQFKNKALGFMYTTREVNNVRVGEVVISNSKESNGEFSEKDRTEETLQNFNLTSKIKADADGYKSLSEVLNTYTTNILDTTQYDKLDADDSKQEDLNSFEFVKTNQGSIWISNTDKILETKDGETPTTDSSFYFYSRNGINEDSLVKDEGGLKTTALPYNNQTSFNKVGYYLVFIKIDPKADTKGRYGTTDDFWQIYAFQYMSDTIDIEVKTTGNVDDAKNNIDVGAGKYTKENVTISWKEPETFESKIVGKYYRVLNKNATRDELLLTSETILNKDKATDKSQVLGGDVAYNSFAKYLIKLERAGKSATYKMFTIDRQPISGVTPYAVTARATKNAVYYEVAYKGDNPVAILNGITNSFATLTWNKKLSGAQITCKYSYTPFVADLTDPTIVNEKWITTKYKLGETINNCDLEEVQSKANVGYDSVLMGQGIYVFTITDEAGNATKYMLVIDKTEAYLQVATWNETDGEYVWGEILPNGSYKLFGDDIKYRTGSHKAIKLEFVDSNNELSGTNGIINYILNDNLSSYKDTKGITYYRGDGSASINALNKLFGDYSASNYLTVENKQVKAYNNYEPDEYYSVSKSVNNPFLEKEIIFDADKLGGATSLYRTFYIIGDNATNSAIHSEPKNSNSFVKIEINKDNSLGMAYFSNDEFDINSVPKDGDSKENIKRLFTGSNSENYSGLGSLKNGAHATKDKYVGFTWLVGQDKFTVTNLEYQFYELNVESFNSIDVSKYFYHKNGDPVNLITSGVASNEVVFQNDSNTGKQRGFFLFKTDYNSTTKAGLYVVTRYYRDDPKTTGADYGDDTYSLTYYFIVDRNGIHDITNEIGKNISIGLLNNSTIIDKEKLSIISTTTNQFNYDVDGDGEFKSDVDIKENYYVYFQTNRVPAVLNVPTGKYVLYNEATDTYYTSNGYFSGQLRVSVYFIDTNAQINPNKRDAQYKIFEKNTILSADEIFFNIDFKQYLLNRESNEFISKLIANDVNGKKWLHLQGRYVVIIEDNVETTLKPNKKIIGFDIIREQYPQADIKIGSKSDAEGKVIYEEMTKVVSTNKGYGEFEVLTNQEFIRVELPEYNLDGVLAQVDQQYIHVKQNRNNEGEKDYIKVEYDKPITAKGFGEADGSNRKYVYLETYLRDASGNVILENLSKPLYYTITIRYEIRKSENEDLLSECYVYYTYDAEGKATKHYYWYSTYVITIDRLAPTENVEYLRSQDVLNNKGLDEAESKSKFEADYYDETNKIYFTYQYADYYNNDKKLSDIYAFRVTENTPYNINDIAEVYYSRIPDPTELALDLPKVSISGFSIVNGLTNESTYKNITGGNEGYYQILEIDKAGNVTQYVIYYATKTQENLLLPVTYTSTMGGSVDLTIGDSLNDATNINLYSIVAGAGNNPDGDYFFHVTLKDNNFADWQGLDFVTNFASEYSGANSVANKIINAINKRTGNYELKILSRTGHTYSLGIGVYSEADKVPLKVENLIENHNGRYYINLRAANVATETNVFYATKIVVVENIEGSTSSKEYICRIENGQYNYYCDNELIKDAMIACSEANATYKITAYDVFGEPYTTRFNTFGQEFYTIEFADFGKAYQVEGETRYYAYSDTTIIYDGIFTIGYDEIYVLVNNKDEIKTEEAKKDYVEILGNSVKIHNKVIKDESGNIMGYEYGIVNVKLQFKEIDGTFDKLYDITIDTTTKPVKLKDYTTNEDKEMTLFDNINLENDTQVLKDYVSTVSDSGIMNLSWGLEDKENYTYSYQFFELKKDIINTENETGVVTEIPLESGKTVKVVETKSDSLGRYWFVINVLTPDGEIMGNKVYAFTVLENVNTLYYFTKDGLAVHANSTFKQADLEGWKYTFEEGEKFIGNLPSTSMPLYITNKPLEINTVGDTTYLAKTAELENGQTLTLYEINATTYQVYCAVLQISETDNLVIYGNINDEIKLGEKALETLVNNSNKEYKINMVRSLSTEGIFAKNNLLLDVYYDNNYVNTIEYDGRFRGLSYIIEGNGSYKFQIRDLAGNVHQFECGETEISLLILREVVITLNDQIPVENAYYNGEVSLKVYAATKYVVGSIQVSAKRNGVDYQVGNANPYIFSDYGTYVVNIKAEFKDEEGNVIPLTKSITFSIINADEVRTAIDLTNLKQHAITKVTNPNGIDVTDAFMHMINNKENAFLIKYDEIMEEEHAKALQVSAGKLKFTIEYEINDGIYPTRKLEIQFTLNNEKPVINCSLGIGESTKKEFNITFNPGIIFEQIGDSYIYINNEIVYVINAESTTDLVTIVRSFEEHGAGDYYIKIAGTSGTVWESFKVEIKEPLNASAIIIIVVVSVVVIGVVVTIIVLRRKMRIR